MPALPSWLGEALSFGRRERLGPYAPSDAERRAVGVQETLDALLLDRVDGAAIWAGRSLELAIGTAEPLRHLETPGDLDEAAACLAAGPFQLGLATALRTLVDNGEPFEISVETSDGARRKITGRTLGGRALLGIVEEGRVGRAITAGEEALLEAERHRDALAEGFDHAPIYAWRRDSHGTFVWANRAYIEAVEAQSLDDVIAEGLELVSSKTGNPIRDLAESARTAGQTQSERAATVIGGSRRTLEFREVPVVGGTLGFAIDVTAQIAAADALRRQIEANELTLDRLHRGVAVFSKELQLSYFNDAIAQLWGLSPSWLESHPGLREVLNALRERSRVPQSRDFSDWRNETLERYGKITEPHETHWHLPNGKAFHVLAQPHPLGGLLLMFEDVTDFFELKRDMATVSAVQRAAFSRLREGILVLGLDGRRRLSNQAFEQMWDLDAEMLENAHLREIATLCAPLFDDDAIWSRMIEDVSGAGDARRPWNERLYRKDGTVLGMASAVLPDGATMFAFSDVTDSVNKERALREQNEKLEELSVLKSAFLDNIHDASQELKIPLNTIVGFTEMLGQGTFGALNEKQREYVEAISTASNDLRQIISGITDLAMVQADHFPLRIEQIPVKSVLEATMRFIERNSVESLVLRLDCPDDIGNLPGDAPRFREIVHHLINTVRTDSGGDTPIEIGARRSGDTLRLWIGSERAPLSSATREIFGKEGGASEILAHKTNALGIAFVRQFVARQGGSVKIETNIGHVDEAIVCTFLTDEAAVRAVAVRDRTAKPESNASPSPTAGEWDEADSASRA